MNLHPSGAEQSLEDLWAKVAAEERFGFGAVLNRVAYGSALELVEAGVVADEVELRELSQRVALERVRREADARGLGDRWRAWRDESGRELAVMDTRMARGKDIARMGRRRS